MVHSLKNSIIFPISAYDLLFDVFFINVIIHKKVVLLSTKANVYLQRDICAEKVDEHVDEKKHF